jgi:hypothetical protein
MDVKNKGTSVICPTGADGSFTGRCAPGHYKVTVLPLPGTPAKDQEKGKEKAAPPAPSMPVGVPERYGSIKETPWELDVPAQGKSGILLKIEGS